MPAAPATDELELVVFGRGFGECILVHVGDRKWVVVDSFCDQHDRPIAEIYLAGLDGEHSVEAIVITHWDDDHAKGASKLIERFEPKEVWIPAILRDREAFEFAYAHTEAESTRKIPLGLRAFVNVANALEEPGREDVVKFSMPGRTVMDGSPTLIRVLSPHDAIVKRGFQALGITQCPGLKEISSPKPNDTCSVLWIERNGGNALLGADMENSTWGWKELVTRPSPTGQQAGFVKVPHHGSPDAHNAALYQSLCATGVWAAVTRFTRAVEGRPSDSDRTRLRGLIGRGWVAGRAGPSASRSQEIQDYEQVQLASIGQTWPLHNQVGFVRMRFSSLGQRWIDGVYGAVEPL